MCDDLANEWGYTLTGTIGKRGQLSSSLSDLYALQSMIKQSLGGQFYLAKLVASGSDANLFSMTEASGGLLDRVLVGCGSYIAGDNGPLEGWSTSMFVLSSGSTDISPPPEGSRNGAQSQQTIALPYHIPCKGCESNIAILEARCMGELHRRCLMAKMKNEPIRALFMELILAGNGGRLSNEALLSLGELAQLHNFHIIVDEIMTGGRVGPGMLCSMNAPVKFMDNISHITMGKWTTMGLCIRRAGFEAQEPSIDQSRGSGTVHNAQLVLMQWKVVQDRLPFIEGRRNAVLASLKLTRDHAWGGGILIFGEKFRLDSKQGLKNRYLPLCESIPIDKIRFATPEYYKKCDCCKRLTTRVNAWLVHSENVGRREDRLFLQHVCARSITNAFRLKDFLLKPKPQVNGFSRKFLTNYLMTCLDHQHRSGCTSWLGSTKEAFMSKATNLVHRAILGGVLISSRISSKRTRYLAAHDSCEYPINSSVTVDVHGPSPSVNDPTNALAIRKEETGKIKRKGGVSSMSFHAKRHKRGHGNKAEASSEDINDSIEDKEMGIVLLIKV
jgi:hypothetical protein